MSGQREMRWAPIQGRKGDSEFGRGKEGCSGRTRSPDFRGSKMEAAHAGP